MLTKFVPRAAAGSLSDMAANWPQYDNPFDNIERLGRWKGGTSPVPPQTDPSGNFSPVTKNSLGADPGQTIYVVAHGWAPGYRSAVEAQNGKLLWWGSEAADDDGDWASFWAWTGISGTVDKDIVVNDTGLIQSIIRQDPKAVVLAYSWIDDSATDSGVLDLDEVYQSEGYTHINGLRLAGALRDAIVPSFWTNGGKLRLIGHSHGSKVVTVAAHTLQAQKYNVAHVTVLDAPECELTLEANAANLLGFYFADMDISATGAFVDNYASCFGVSYGGAPAIVETSLDATEVFDFYDLGDLHTYAAAWYGGAACGAKSETDPPIGLAWPPAPADWAQGFYQGWDGGDQWLLDPGFSGHGVFAYGTQPLIFDSYQNVAGVTGDPASGLTFTATPNAYSVFNGNYENDFDDEGYGIGVDINWTDPQEGDWLLFVIFSPLLGYVVVAALDGRTQSSLQSSIAISAATWSELSLPLYVYFYSTGSTVTLSNFRLISVGSDDDRLRKRTQFKRHAPEEVVRALKCEVS